jgi:cysteine synthase
MARSGSRELAHKEGIFVGITAGATYTGMMNCADRRAVPLKLWVK